VSPVTRSACFGVGRMIPAGSGHKISCANMILRTPCRQYFSANRTNKIGASALPDLEVAGAKRRRFT
jgi:hypothetical protein